MNLYIHKSISLFLGLCLGGGVVLSQDSWGKIQDLPIQERLSATSFSLGFDGYVGLGENDSLLNNFYSLSFIDNTWRNVSQFPASARKGSVSFVIGGYAYVGLGVSSAGYEHDFWRYDSSIDDWQEIASFPGTGRAYSVADTLNGYGYVLTGIDSSGYPTDVWRYDAKTDRWEEMNDFNGNGRTNGYIFSLNNTLYVGNGYQGSSFQNNGFKYIPATDSWEEFGVFSGTLRQGTSFASANNKGYFGLGYNGREWWEFDPTTEEWAQTTDYGDSEDSNVGGAIAISLANRIYVVSGLQDDATIQDVFKFTPEMELPSESYGFSYEQKNARYVKVSFFGEQDFTSAEKVLARKKINAENWVVVDTIGSDIFYYIDTTLSEASYYTYSIAAFNANGITEFVNGSSVHTYNYIESPQNIALTKDQSNDINLTWDDVSSDEDAYVIEMKANYETDYNVVATLSENSEAYIYKNPQKEVTYQFRIVTHSDVLANDTTEEKQIALTEPGRWETMTSFPGAGRIRAVSFVLDGKAYMGLGREESGGYLKDFWRFDALTEEWTQLNDFSGLARMGAVAFTIGDFAYVGTGNNSDSLLSDFWKYNPSEDSWTQIENFGGGKRTGASVFSLKGNGYVGYGATNINWTTDIKDFWKYDPVNDIWTEVSSILTSGRIGATSFALADTGYVIFGANYSVEKPYKLYAYYPDDDKWEEKNVLNSHYDYSSSGGVFIIDNNAYISGGLGYKAGFSYEHSMDTWKYDPVNNQFLLCGDINFSQYNQVAFALEGRGYTFTGNVVDNSGYDYNTAKAQVFYPDSIPEFPEPEANWEGDKLVVQWNDISFSENGYNLYRSFSTNEYELLATLPEDSLSYNDSELDMEELDTVNYKVEVLWDDKTTFSETMRIRPLNAPEVISVKSLAYNEVDITIKKTSSFAESVLIFRYKGSGNWGSSPNYDYENLMEGPGDTIVTIHYSDDTLDELELLKFKTENILLRDIYSYSSAVVEFSDVYTLLKHPVVDTMIRTTNEIELVWGLQSIYADSVSIERMTVGDEEGPVLLATNAAKDTVFFDSDVNEEDVYIYYLTAFNDTMVSKVTLFNTSVYTSVNNDYINEEISLYPNPVVNELVVGLPQDYASEKVIVRLYNHAGVLLEQVLSNNTAEIKLPVSHLKRGVYIVEINSGGRKEFKKIIKE